MNLTRIQHDDGRSVLVVGLHPAEAELLEQIVEGVFTVLVLVQQSQLAIVIDGVDTRRLLLAVSVHDFLSARESHSRSRSK